MSGKNQKRKMKIRKAETADFEAMAALISRMNQMDEHHCLHCDEEAAGVLEELKDIGSRDELFFALAIEGDRLTAVFGGEMDEERVRYWIWGPFVEQGDRETVSEQLLDFCQAAHSKLKLISAFKDVKNEEGIQFLIDRGFTPKDELVYVYSCTTPSLVPPPNNLLIEFEEQYKADLHYLHTTYFKSSYYTTDEMIGLIDDTHKVYLYLEEGKAVGYLYAEKDPTGNGYIHFLATDKPHRRKGMAAQLMQEALHWLQTNLGVPAVQLTVYEKNNAKELYAKMKFQLLYTGISLVKKIGEETPPVA